MAGGYGEINSRTDFFRVLGEATDLARRILASSPDYEVMQRIEAELTAMKQWTDDGREPSEEERQSIDVGLVAVRELEGGSYEFEQLAGKLHILNAYFEDWPTDAQAAGEADDSIEGA